MSMLFGFSRSSLITDHFDMRLFEPMAERGQSFGSEALVGSQIWDGSISSTSLRIKIGLWGPGSNDFKGVTTDRARERDRDHIAVVKVCHPRRGQGHKTSLYK